MLPGFAQFFEHEQTAPLPYDAEVEYIEIGYVYKAEFYIDLPGGSYPGLGFYARCTAVAEKGGDNTSLIGIPNGKMFTDFTVSNLYGNTGFTSDAAAGDVIEWYCKDDGTRQTAWVKRNGVVGQNYAPIDRAREDIAPVEYFRLIGASNNQQRFKPVRIEAIQIFNFDQLIYNFIPVRFTNELGQSEGAMYDRVSGQLFRNQGTGNFIIGRDTNPISARSYVNDGLVAMWDGIENAGWGVHDPNATVWKDLIGSEDLMVSSNTTWFNDALGSASRLVNGVAYSSSYISSIGTIEACFDLSSDSENGSGRGLVCNTNSRAIMGGGLSKIRSRGEASVMTQEIAGRLITAFNTSVVYGQTSSVDLIYFNGASQQTVSASGNWALLNRIRIGGSGNSANAAIIGKCHCVRIYSRALTAAEIAANYAIDKARFKLP